MANVVDCFQHNSDTQLCVHGSQLTNRVPLSISFQVLIHLHVNMKNMSKKSEQSKTKVEYSSFLSHFSPSSFLHLLVLQAPGA